LKETVKGIIIKDFKGIEKEIRIRVGEKRILLRIFITSLQYAENSWEHLLFSMTLPRSPVLRKPLPAGGRQKDSA